MWGLRSSRTVVLLAAATAFVVFCLLPVASMLVAATRSANAAAIRTAVLDARQLRLLSTTLIFGVGTALLSTIIGAPLGFVLARVSLPHPTAFRLALIAPAVIPPYITALALTFVVGSVAFNVVGAIVAMTVACYPLSMMATEVGLRRIDARLEDAAALVTAPVHVLRRITGPLVQPYVMAAALVVFVLAISDFGVPGVLRVRVFTTEVFTAFAALYDFGRATMLSLPLILVSFGVAAAAATALRHRFITTRRSLRSGLGEMFQPWRNAGVAMTTCAIVALLMVPLLALAREAAQAAAILQPLRDSREAVVNSLVWAALGASAATMVGLAVGYVRAHVTSRLAAAMDGLLLALFAVPSAVVGIGLIATWNRAGPWGSVYGTRAMFVLAYMARFVPVAALSIAATLRSVPDSHEEAAAAAGAGWLRTVTHILLPEIRTGLLVTWAIAFALSFGEVGASVLIAPPGEATLPMRIYTMTANAPPGYVGALALFQALVALCPLAVLGLAVSRRAKR